MVATAADCTFAVRQRALTCRSHYFLVVGVDLFDLAVLAHCAERECEIFKPLQFKRVDQQHAVQVVYGAEVFPVRTT